MNIPRIAFGKGFFGHRPKISDAPVYQVNVSNGMPIISHKKAILEKALSATVKTGPTAKGKTKKVA